MCDTRPGEVLETPIGPVNLCEPCNAVRHLRFEFMEVCQRFGTFSPKAHAAGRRFRAAQVAAGLREPDPVDVRVSVGRRISEWLRRMWRAPESL